MSDSSPTESANPPTAAAKAAVVGRRRSKSFYGKENSVPEKPGAIERKPTSVDLQNIILRLTLKENIQKEIDKFKEAGQYQSITQPEGVDIFEEHASECLKKNKDDIKKFRSV